MNTKEDTFSRAIRELREMGERDREEYERLDTATQELLDSIESFTEAAEERVSNESEYAPDHIDELDTLVVELRRSRRLLQKLLNRK